MCLSPVFVSSGEDIVREGEFPDAMYFVVTGSVEIVKVEIVKIPRDVSHLQDCIPEPDTEQDDYYDKKVERRVGLLGPKDIFGEHAVLPGHERHLATVRAITFCELRLLSRESFLRVTQNLPRHLKGKILSKLSKGRKKSVSHLQLEKPEQKGQNEDTLRRRRSSGFSRPSFILSERRRSSVKMEGRRSSMRNSERVPRASFVSIFPLSRPVPTEPVSHSATGLKVDDLCEVAILSRKNEQLAVELETKKEEMARALAKKDEEVRSAMMLIERRNNESSCD